MEEITLLFKKEPKSGPLEKLPQSIDGVAQTSTRLDEAESEGYSPDGIREVVSSAGNLPQQASGKKGFGASATTTVVVSRGGFGRGRMGEYAG